MNEKITFIEGSKVTIEETIPEQIIPAETKVVEYDLKVVKKKLFEKENQLPVIESKLASVQKAVDDSKIEIASLQELATKIEAVIPKEELIEEPIEIVK